MAVRFLVRAFSQAAFGLRRGAAADGDVLALNLPVEHDLRGGIAPEFFIGEDCHQAFLQASKAAFDLAFGLRAGSDPMGYLARIVGGLARSGWVLLRAFFLVLEGGNFTNAPRA